jgi:hypothetical protein
MVFDKIDLDSEGFPASVVARAEDKVYVLNGHVLEGMMGNVERARLA